MPQSSPDVQNRVQQILDQAVGDGRESAIQVAAYQHGELIVDAHASSAEQPISGGSLLPFFSTGKGIAATIVHILVERGILSLDDPVARHWPEFGANGKEGIALRHVLSHTAGMAMMPERGDMALAAGWDGMCDYLANAEPIHPPGAHRHYHAITYSWLVGEVVQRADGRDFGSILQEEVCRPLGIDALFFGVPEDRLGECVDALPQLPVPVSDPPPAPAPPDPVAQRAIPPWVWPLEEWINSAPIRRACIPASNGFGNARALARHYAAVLPDGVDGVRLLSDTTLAAATQWNAATDGAIPGGGRWGMGYALQGPDEAPGTVFGHGGYGGSTAFADTRSGLAVGLVKSRMGGSITGEVVETIRRSIGQ